MIFKDAPAIILASKGSLWKSCEVIVSNLGKTYQALWGKYSNFYSFRSHSNTSEVFALAKNIQASSPSQIIFVDHFPHPESLLLALQICYGDRPLPPLTFHVFGDFTYLSGQWLKLEPLLKRTQTRFICASDRQRELLEVFVKKKKGLTRICPFPVDTSFYRFDPLERSRVRAQLGIADSDWVAIYTGRFSVQKNVLRLTEELAATLQTSSPQSHLILVGNFDDMGAYFFGIKCRPGSYYHEWNRLYSTFPKAIQRRIHMIDQVNPEKLRGYYNAADCFVSLSLHHDEDFGMSVAESMCCGTSSILTDWGGFASFKNYSEDCHLVPVQIGQDGLEVSLSQLRGFLQKEVHLARNDPRRQLLSQKHSRHLSIPAARAALETIYQTEAPQFPGFTSWTNDHSRLLKNGVLFPTGTRKGTFYEKVYSSYLAQLST